MLNLVGDVSHLLALGLRKPTDVNGRYRCERSMARNSRGLA